MKKILLYIFLIQFSVSNAQVNLIENGGFEQSRSHLGQSKFEGWRFHRNLSVQKVAGYKGNNAAKVYMNSLIFSVVKQQNFNAIPVQGGAIYKLSFWIKGEQGIESITPIVRWYDNNGNQLPNGRVYLQEQITLQNWSKKELLITVPAIAVKMGLSFSVSGNGEALYIDEVSFVKEGEGAEVKVPTGIDIKKYQREIAVTWHNGQPGTKWEVLFDEKSTIVSKNKFFISGLSPNTNHTFRVRTVIGSKQSGFSRLFSIKTQNYIKTQNSSFRVPFIRTLPINGNPNQIIELFYTDLYNTDALISFYIDEVKITPVNNKLKFPKKGKQKLKVIIDEGLGYKWEYQYDLNVQ